MAEEETTGKNSRAEAKLELKPLPKHPGKFNREEPFHYTWVKLLSATAVEGVIRLEHKPDEILIYNGGSNECYIDFDRGVTTSTGFLLKAGNSVTLTAQVQQIHGICSAQETTTLYVIAGAWDLINW